MRGAGTEHQVREHAVYQEASAGRVGEGEDKRLLDLF